MMRMLLIVTLLASMQLAGFSDEPRTGRVDLGSKGATSISATEVSLADGATVISAKHVSTKPAAGKNIVHLSGDAMLSHKMRGNAEFRLYANQMRLTLNAPKPHVAPTVAPLDFAADGSCRFASGALKITADRATVSEELSDKRIVLRFTGNVSIDASGTALSTESLLLTSSGGKWMVGKSLLLPSNGG